MQFPRSERPMQIVKDVVKAFSVVSDQIDSDNADLSSNTVLKILRPQLLGLGFDVESGKSRDAKVSVPVLYGLNGRPEKTFDADAYHSNEKLVLEIEAGRAVVNNQFLKDLFQACMMDDVEVLAIAVRNQYKRSRDFDTVCRFFETLFASARIRLPLRAIVVIGY
ncbi:MAG: hypothetical protein H6509_00070 [Bryobacterales bacterium]|nr:hypothetical protein [Bryobacterales bacterium]